MAVLFFQNKFHPRAKQAPEYNPTISFPASGVAYLNNGIFYADNIDVLGCQYHYKPLRNEKSPTLPEWVFNTFGDDDPEESSYVPGTYYKRIWRPGAPYLTTAVDNINQSFVALRILLFKLQQLFEIVEPHPDNNHVYGHSIRELLLVACMEAESSWSAVLKENKYQPGKWKTTDYVKLKKAMLLDAYQVGLSNYSTYLPVYPFASWDEKKPTTSLPWYNAYNQTKHDREGKLQLATLEHAISAIGAVVVLFRAQFGREFRHAGLDSYMPVIESVYWTSYDFSVDQKAIYLPVRVFPGIGSHGGWTAMDYVF